MDKFLIIRMSSLGDIIHALPAFAVLRRGFPDARIAWVVERPGSEILDLVPGIDEVVVRGEKGWIRKIRDRDQTALDFQGLIQIGPDRPTFRGADEDRFLRKEPPGTRGRALLYRTASTSSPKTATSSPRTSRLLEKLGLDAGTEAEYEFPIVIPESPKAASSGRPRRLGRTPARGSSSATSGRPGKANDGRRSAGSKLLTSRYGEDLFYLLLWGNARGKGGRPQDRGRDGNVPWPPSSPIPEVLALITGSRLLISGDTFALQAACALDDPGRGDLRSDQPGPERPVPGAGQDGPIPNGLPSML